MGGLDGTQRGATLPDRVTSIDDEGQAGMALDTAIDAKGNSVIEF